ncbi:hypothetical protein CsSME_00034592 [Camellia sinensis var. sinensis]
MPVFFSSPPPNPNSPRSHARACFVLDSVVVI